MRVTFGHPRATFGHPRGTFGHQKGTFGRKTVMSHQLKIAIMTNFKTTFNKKGRENETKEVVGAGISALANEHLGVKSAESAPRFV